MYDHIINLLAMQKQPFAFTLLLMVSQKLAVRKDNAQWLLIMQTK